MGVIKCPSCGKTVSDNAKACPNCGQPIKKKTPIFAWIILVFVVFYFAGTFLDKSEAKQGTPPSEPITQEPSAKKWEDMVEYALIKNKNAGRVRCKSKFTHGKEYILCAYSVSGYDKSSLFFVESDGLVAVNGTARQLTHYDEIRNYNYDTDGEIDIPSIIASF